MAASGKNKLWVTKYRPQHIEDIIFQSDAHRSFFHEIVEGKRQLPNLLLSGVQGTGKTTISLALMKDLNINPLDVLLVKCSDETGVDNLRDNVGRFAETMPLGDIKIVRMEECLEENTLIMILRNEIEIGIPIKDLLPETDLIKTFNFEENRIEFSSFELLCNGMRNDIYELELEHGEIIKCTSNHKWFVEIDGKIEIKTTLDLFETNHILSLNYK